MKTSTNLRFLLASTIVLLLLANNQVNCGFFGSVGQGISKAAHAVASKTASVSTTVAKGVVTGAKATANGVVKATKATGHGISTAAQATSKFFVKGATNSKEAAAKVRDWIKLSAKKVIEDVKLLKSKDFLSQLFYFLHHLNGKIEQTPSSIPTPILASNSSAKGSEIADPVITSTEKIPEKVQFLKDQLSPLQDPETRKLFFEGFTSSLTKLQNSPNCKEVVTNLIPTLPIINNLIEVEFLHSKKIQKEDIINEQIKLKENKNMHEEDTMPLQDAKLNVIFLNF